MAIVAGFVCENRNFYESHKQKIHIAMMTLVFWSYLSLGGLIFKRLEGFQDADEAKNIADAKMAIMKKHPVLSNEAMDDLFRELSERGVKGLRPANATTKWTFGNALLFSATLLTTVGYGHLSPVSSIGKVVCIVYTSVGIPVTLYLMTMYVSMLTRLSDYHRDNLFRKFKHHLKPTTIYTLHAFTCSMLIIVGSFLLPASIFDYLEVQWNYLDALYFCFISLTTVGLGDFVPGLNINHPYIDLYRFAATVYIIIGVTAVMFLLAVANEYVLNIKHCWDQEAQHTPSEKKCLLREDLLTYGSLVIRTIQSPNDIKIQIPAS